jgi:predicted nucleotidyltransferase
MPVDRLLQDLSELPRAFELGLYARAEVRAQDDEREGAEFGPLLDISVYVNQQREHLQTVDACVKEAAAAVLGDYPAAIFITGSLARLEYLPSTSDIDLLGVVTGAIRKPAYEEAELVSRLEEEIRRVASLRSGKSIEASISGIPITRPDSADPSRFVRAKIFYSEGELINFVGKEYESPWAGFERASLIFESSLVYGDEDLAASIVSSIDHNLYKIARDLYNKRFPVVGYCLLLFLAKSSLLAKAAFIHSLNDDLKRIDRETAKVMLARVCSSCINLITLHVVYWSKLLGASSRSESDILTDLQKPPIWKAIRIIPHYISFMADQRVCQIALSEIFPDAKKADSVFSLLDDVFHNVRTIGSDDCIPLWYRASQLMRLCQSLRDSHFSLSEDIVARLRTWSVEMDCLLRKCSRITQALAITDSRGRSGMVTFHDLISHLLHGEPVVETRGSWKIPS